MIFSLQKSKTFAQIQFFSKNVNFFKKTDIFPKIKNSKVYFAKFTRLACLLSFASLLYILMRLIRRQSPSSAGNSLICCHLFTSTPRRSSQIWKKQNKLQSSGVNLVEPNLRHTVIGSAQTIIPIKFILPLLARFSPQLNLVHNKQKEIP